MGKKIRQCIEIAFIVVFFSISVRSIYNGNYYIGLLELLASLLALQSLIDSIILNECYRIIGVKIDNGEIDKRDL